MKVTTLVEDRHQSGMNWCDFNLRKELALHEALAGKYITMAKAEVARVTDLRKRLGITT